MDSATQSTIRDSRKWEPLIAALRAELQEFGGLIRLLNLEQDDIFANPASVTKAPEAVAGQHALAVASSRIRMGTMVAVGRDQGSEPASIDEILAKAPDEIRPLLSALFSEVGKLAVRAEDRTIQNDWLRKRASVLAATMADRAATGA